MDLGAVGLHALSAALCCCPLCSAMPRVRRPGVQELPRPRARAPRPLRRTVLLLVLRDDGAVLLQRRSNRGVWAGLWTPPEFTDLAQAREFCARELISPEIDAAPRPPLRHRFTHFDFEMTPLRTRCAGMRPQVGEERRTLWYDVLATAPMRPPIGLPAPIALLLRSIERDEVLVLAAAGS